MPVCQLEGVQRPTPALAMPLAVAVAVAVALAVAAAIVQQFCRTVAPAFS